MKTSHCVRRPIALAVLVACLAAAVGAQEVADPPRQKVLGKVLTSHDQPWAGATVRLIAWPYARYWFVGEPDELTVTTDARGRFEAQLLPQRHYSGWAFAKLENGGYRLTRVVNDVVPAYLVELREREHEQVPMRLRIVEPAGAKPFGELAFRLLSRTPSQVFVHDLTLDENGEAEMPAIPSTLVRVEALTKERVRVWNSLFYTTAVRRAAEAKRGVTGRSPVPAVHVMSGDARELSILNLPKPTVVKFSVQDKEGPVDGAEILIGAQSSAGSISDVNECRVLTRTDASGIAKLPMYLSWQADGNVAGSAPDVAVRSDDHFERMFRMMRGLRGDRDRPTRTEAEAHVMLTGPSFSATGRLMLEPGKPAAGVSVLLYSARASGNGRSSSISTKPIVTETDASGAFAFPGRMPDRDYRLTALLPTLEAAGREEVYLASSAAVKVEGDHGTLVASSLVHVDIQVTTSSRSPADRARVYLAEERNRPRTPVTFLTDRAGRCSLRVPREQLLTVIVASDDGFAAARLPHAGAAPRVAQTVQLQVGGVLHGTAVDAAGKPLAGVRVSVRGADRMDPNTWYASILRDVSSTTFALAYRGIYTDAKGKFRAVFPQAGVPLKVTAWRRGDDGSYMQLVGAERELELQAEGGEPLRLKLDHWKRN